MSGHKKNKKLNKIAKKRINMSPILRPTIQPKSKHEQYLDNLVDESIKLGDEVTYNPTDTVTAMLFGDTQYYLSERKTPVSNSTFDWKPIEGARAIAYVPSATMPFYTFAVNFDKDGNVLGIVSFLTGYEPQFKGNSPVLETYSLTDDDVFSDLDLVKNIGAKSMAIVVGEQIFSQQMRQYFGDVRAVKFDDDNEFHEFEDEINLTLDAYAKTINLMSSHNKNHYVATTVMRPNGYLD